MKQMISDARCPMQNGELAEKKAMLAYNFDTDSYVVTKKNFHRSPPKYVHDTKMHLTFNVGLANVMHDTLSSACLIVKLK